MSAIVEIIGLAGSGKSTLAKGLKKETDQIDIRFRLPTIRAFPRIMKSLNHNIKLARELGVTDKFFLTLKMLVHVDAMVEYLSKHKAILNTHVVFDQGPIFELASLQVNGFGKSDFILTNEYSKTILDRYSKVVDFIIYLKADEEELISRIKNRSDNHILKNCNVTFAREFIHQYNTFYESIISYLTTNANVLIVQIDTSTYNERDTLKQAISQIKLCAKKNSVPL